MAESMSFVEACKYYYKHFGIVNAFKLAVYPRLFGKLTRQNLFVPAVLKFQLK